MLSAAHDSRPCDYLRASAAKHPADTIKAQAGCCAHRHALFVRIHQHQLHTITDLLVSSRAVARGVLEVKGLLVDSLHQISYQACHDHEAGA